LRLEEAPIDSLGAELFAPLDRLVVERPCDRIEAVQLAGCLYRVDRLAELLEPYIRFDPVHYTRLTLGCSAGYEALLLCWMPGQFSPLHDHSGSECAFRVLRGEGVETKFRLAGAAILNEDTRSLPTNTVCASHHGDIHELGCDCGEGLVTLHLYSPSAPKMRIYHRGLAGPLEQDAA
jgi:cysteine dioxygenase